MDDDFMKQLAAHLKPRAAAVIALVTSASKDKILPQIKIPGTLIQTSLDNDSEQQLADAVAAAGGR